MTSSIFSCCEHFCLTAVLMPAACFGLIFIAGARSDSPKISSSTSVPALAISLDQAVNLAISSNPALKTANLQVRQSDAKLGEAKAQQRFQFSFNSAVGGSNATIDQAPSQTENFGVFQNTITSPLPIGNRLKMAVRQAQSEQTASAAESDAARRNLISQVEQAYYDVLLKRELLKSAQEALNEAQRQLDETKKRNAAGDAPDLDVIRAQSPAASAKASLFEAQNALCVSKETLNDLIGEPLDRNIELVSGIESQAPSPYTLDQARTTAMRNSPDVKAQGDRVEAAKSALAFAKLSREPSYSIGVSDTRSNDITSFSRNDSVQASITIPLSDGGLATEQVREAQAALEQSQASLESARKAVLLSVSGAYLSAQSDLQQEIASKSAWDIAQTAYGKTFEGYQNGLYALTDALSAEAALASARTAYVQSVYSAALADKLLQNVLGDNDHDYENRSTSK